VDYVESLITGSRFFGCGGRVNNASIQIIRSMLPDMQKGTFNLEQFNICTRPKSLIEGYENNWGKLPKSAILAEDSGLPVEIVQQEMDKKIREYHAEELVNDHAVTSGNIHHSGHLRNKRLAHAQVQDLALPWLGWFQRSGLG
jgi:hypothetical protein